MTCPGCIVYGPGSRLWDDGPGHRIKCARLNIDNMSDEITLAIWRGEIDIKAMLPEASTTGSTGESEGA